MRHNNTHNHINTHNHATCQRIIKIQLPPNGSLASHQHWLLHVLLALFRGCPNNEGICLLESRKTMQKIVKLLGTFSGGKLRLPIIIWQPQPHPLGLERKMNINNNICLHDSGMADELRDPETLTILALDTNYKLAIMVLVCGSCTIDGPPWNVQR